MSRLTIDERRRANELRTMTSTPRAPHTFTAEHLAVRDQWWAKNARVAALLGIGLGAAFALAQLLHQLALYGPGSLLDWLLPRL